MPAQKPPTGVPVGFPHTSIAPIFDWLKDHLLPSVVLIFLIVIFFLFGTFDKQPKSEQIIDDLINKGVVFENTNDEARFKEFLGNGIRAGSGGYGNLMKAFIYLSGEYTRSPTSEKRETLSGLAQYISKNFTKEAEAADLTIPCREAACGAVFIYSADLEKIKQQVFESKVLNNLEKQAILVNLENAALAAGKGDKAGEFNGLSIAFQNLKNIWQIDKEENVKALAESLLGLMEKTNPDYYKFGVKVGTFKLD